MKKRKIEPGYLQQILATDVTDEKVSAWKFADTLSRFAQDYLRGAMNVKISGYSDRTVSLKLPVVTHLIRLICELAEEDELIELNITLGDELVMESSFRNLSDPFEVSYMVKVARLAGFEISRDGSSMSFTAKTFSSSVLQLYVPTNDNFMDMLILMFKM